MINVGAGVILYCLHISFLYGCIRFISLALAETYEDLGEMHVTQSDELYYII